MFENRSFDNLLGRLYQPGEVPSFAGVAGLDLSNPVPDWAADADPGTGPRLVPYGTAADMNIPSPDPGEEYPHVNTQLFGLIDPPSNRGMVLQHIVSPFNAPASPGQRPTMDGFVTDYISAFMAEMGRPPVFEEYAQIMTGYAPLQVPVTSALARGFATFDHWFCEVPSQTFPNRSFFHAATSSGFVVNMSPAESFPLHNTAETIFERLEAQGLTWRVYCDPPSHISLTGIIHAPRLHERWETNFFTTDRFLARRGHRAAADVLVHRAQPAVRPQRHASGLRRAVPRDGPRPAVLAAGRRGAAGEDLRRDPLLGVADRVERLQHAVHGHLRRARRDLRPRPAAAVPAPDPTAPAGQMGFRFDRSGLRVPAIAVSAWIPEQTVINDQYRHTSVIRTLRERWQLGAPLTARDAAAPDIAPVLSLETPRDPDGWPEVTPRPVPPFSPARVRLEARLKGLCKAACFPVLALAKDMGLPAPDIDQDEAIGRADAIGLINEVFGHMFPGLHAS